MHTFNPSSNWAAFVRVFSRILEIPDTTVLTASSIRTAGPVFFFLFIKQKNKKGASRHLKTWDRS